LSPTNPTEANFEKLPRAKIRPRSRVSLAFIWIVPAIAAVAAGWLIWANFRAMGPVIQIEFTNGNGLQANQTVLKYRGVRVGEVRAVQLTEDTGRVLVTARLAASAKNLARAGSQFWIVRPEVGAGGLHGLETIVSGPYIQVQPGGGPTRTKLKFIGAEEAPILEKTKSGLQIVLTTPQIKTLSIGSPIYYRGVEVGSVQYYNLGSNATLVEIHALIKPAFAALVREDSAFWNAGGVSMRLHLTGLNISAENIKSLVIGGIAFATPSPAGKAAVDGDQFQLSEKSEERWLKWSPTIELTNANPTASADSASSLLLNTMEPASKE